jgi:hypothetical protein
MQGGNHVIITILEIESAMICSHCRVHSPPPIKVWKVGGAIDIYNCCCNRTETPIELFCDISVLLLGGKLMQNRSYIFNK